MKYLISTLFFLLCSTSIAAGKLGYTCYDYQSLGGIIDVNLDLKQVCSHPGDSLEDCTVLNQPFEVITHNEKGNDNTLIQGYIAIYSLSPQGNSNYIRIYSKPFILTDNTFVYKASVAGDLRKFEIPKLEVNTVSDGEFICKKWK